MIDRYRVQIAPEALDQIVRIVSWWRRNRRAAPELFSLELERILLLISERPELGRRARGRRIGDARVLLLPRSSYLVFYQVQAEAREVWVVHIRHSRRRPLGRR
jgi:hypothetical protein